MKTIGFSLAMLLALSILSGFKPKKDLEQPQSEKGTVIKHLAYSLVIDPERRQSRWVSYVLTDDELNAVVKRNDNFIPDPLAPKAVALRNEYAYPYDKGHLAPADHMLFSDTVMQESFFMTNMGPQYYSFNRGKWRSLEALTAKIAHKYGTVYVTSGPVFISTIDTIGNGLPVPSHYFKALLVYNNNEKQAIGFLMPNKKLTEKPETYAISIDSLEKVTHLDLFYRLPNGKEKELEKSFDIGFWF